MGKWTEQILSKELKMANSYMKKMFNLFSHQGNANQNQIEILSPLSEWLSCRKQKTINAGEDAGWEKESLYTVNGNTNE